jgi:hypothetical protein
MNAPLHRHTCLFSKMVPVPLLLDSVLMAIEAARASLSTVDKSISGVAGQTENTSQTFKKSNRIVDYTILLAVAILCRLIGVLSP